MVGAMTVIVETSDPMGDRARGEILFRGDVILFKGIAALSDLRDLSAGMVRDALQDDDPTTAHLRIAPQDYALKVAGLQMRHRKDPAIRAAWKSVLGQAGCVLDALFWDWCHLRSLPPGEGNSARATRPLGPHRDTWCSNLYAQHNWWVTLFPLTEGRSMALYPGYWTRPLKNSSADWDLQEMRARARADPVDARARPKSDDYPVLPRPLKPVDETDQLRLAIEPDDLLCFSGAHLHASVPNRTPRGRFSLELRTVWSDDVREGRGAPNVDGAAPHVAWDWFKAVSDGAPLAPAPPT